MHAAESSRTVIRGKGAAAVADGTADTVVSSVRDNDATPEILEPCDDAPYLKKSGQAMERAGNLRVKGASRVTGLGSLLVGNAE